MEGARVVDHLLREEDIAELTGMSVFTLQSWRRPGSTRGPRWVNVGTNRRAVVRYRESDVQEWIAGLPARGAEALA